ncbi:cytochrome c oxidase subunit II [soil metagenome]
MQRASDGAGRHQRRRWTVVAAVLALTATLSGCGAVVERGFLPEAITTEGSDIITFWNGTWIAALAVGVLVWGLILWCMVAYRRRSVDQPLPPQIRYNVPLEILYTVVPLLMVAVLFGKTVELENAMLDTSEEPDVIVNVAGKKWSWDFNYVNENVYIAGVQADGLSDGRKGVVDTLPTMVLPVDSRVEFVLTSRDVIHSFWVPQFLRKLDLVPGRVNTFQVVTTEEGTFQGKCAELCGAYHSQMLFQVEVVSQAEYDAAIADLEASGNSGQIGLESNTYPLQIDQDEKFLEGSN